MMDFMQDVQSVGSVMDVFRLIAAHPVIVGSILLVAIFAPLFVVQAVGKRVRKPGGEIDGAWQTKAEVRQTGLYE